MHMELKKCTDEYWEFVRLLRNDPRVQSGFIQKSEISAEQQINYMKNNCWYYRICLVDNKPAGYVGVIDRDIRICTHPDFQKLGVAKFMLNEIMKIWPDAFGKVKLENDASRMLFKSCGFKEKYVIYER